MKRRLTKVLITCFLKLIDKGVKLIKVIQNSCITLINEVALFTLKAFPKLKFFVSLCDKMIPSSGYLSALCTRASPGLFPLMLAYGAKFITGNGSADAFGVGAVKIPV